MMRTWTGRRVGVSRAVVRKPRGAATTGRHDRLVHVAAIRFRRARGLEHPLVVARHDLAELLDGVVPVGEKCGRDSRSRFSRMTSQDVTQERAVVVVEWIEIDHLAVESLFG